MEPLQEGPTPLYVQLADQLRQQIEAGDLEPGSALPSEPDLVRRYNLSRTTVRQALNLLADENVIIKVQGKGTYVRQPAIQQDLMSLQTITEIVTRAGLVPDVQVLAVESQTQVAPHVVKQLQLSPDDRVVRVKRVHLVEQQPIAYAVIYLSGRFEWRFSVEDLTKQSIYAWLEEQADVLVDQGQQIIRATAASDEVAAALNVEAGEPVLYVESTSTSETGVPVDYTEFYFPSDRYALVVMLRRTHRGISLEEVHADLGENS